MARYAVTVRTPQSPEDAFAYVATLSNLPEWDAGVGEAKQVRGDGPGPDAAYEVVLAQPGKTRLTYETTEFDGEALTTTLVAEYSWYRSIDTVSATTGSDGTELTYDATLQLKGPLALGDPLFRLVFNRIGDKAAEGLLRELDGEKVA